MCKQLFLKRLPSRSMNNQKVNAQSNIVLCGSSLQLLHCETLRSHPLSPGSLKDSSTHNPLDSLSPCVPIDTVISERPDTCFIIRPNRVHLLQGSERDKDIRFDSHRLLKTDWPEMNIFVSLSSQCCDSPFTSKYQNLHQRPLRKSDVLIRFLHVCVGSANKRYSKPQIKV